MTIRSFIRRTLGSRSVSASRAAVLGASIESAPYTQIALVKEKPVSGEVTWPEPPNPPAKKELIELTNSFPYWYHRIYLGHGVYTLEQPEFHEPIWNRFLKAFPQDLDGASVLDIGCNAGFFSLQTKLLGAGKVVGIEFDERFFKQAGLCADIWQADIDYRLLDAHGLDEMQETFDIAIFLGIIYHLKNPLQVIEQVGRLCNDAVLIETEVIPPNPANQIFARQGPHGQLQITRCNTGMMKFLETTELNGEHTNWWIPDTECLLGMLRTAGFQYFSRPVYHHEGRIMLIASKFQDSLFNLQAL